MAFPNKTCVNQFLPKDHKITLEDLTLSNFVTVGQRGGISIHAGSNYMQSTSRNTNQDNDPRTHYTYGGARCRDSMMGYWGQLPRVIRNGEVIFVTDTAISSTIVDMVPDSIGGYSRVKLEITPQLLDIASEQTGFRCIMNPTKLDLDLDTPTAYFFTNLDSTSMLVSIIGNHFSPAQISHLFFFIDRSDVFKAENYKDASSIFKTISNNKREAFPNNGGDTNLCIMQSLFMSTPELWKELKDGNYCNGVCGVFDNNVKNYFKYFKDTLITLGLEHYGKSAVQYILNRLINRTELAISDSQLLELLLKDFKLNTK